MMRHAPAAKDIARWGSFCTPVAPETDAAPKSPLLGSMARRVAVLERADAMAPPLPTKRKVSNCKAKGTHNEHRSMVIFEKAGYETMRSAASLSTWDFIAWNANEVVYCQVKTRDWPGTIEMEQIRMAVVPGNGRKLIHRWIDGKRLPDVKEVR